MKAKRDRLFKEIEKWCAVSLLTASLFVGLAIAQRTVGDDYRIATFVALGLAVISGGLFVAGLIVGRSRK